MSHPNGPRMPAQVGRYGLPELGFLAASLIWAAVMIDTGSIGWPLAAWTSTALTPLALHRRKLRGQGDRVC